MKISEAWLRELVDPPGGRDELVQRLTMAGLKIESVEPVAGAFSDVVVAEVKSVKRHPDAEKLSVCTVWDGAAEHAGGVRCAERARGTQDIALRG